jgi:hypothetical protein
MFWVRNVTNGPGNRWFEASRASTVFREAFGFVGFPVTLLTITIAAIRHTTRATTRLGGSVATSGATRQRRRYGGALFSHERFFVRRHLASGWESSLHRQLGKDCRFLRWFFLGECKGCLSNETGEYKQHKPLFARNSHVQFSLFARNSHVQFCLHL